ncbi:MAG: hypothetical protein SPD11_08590 [Sphaerochaetaceae bacterium]|nr:hypothetical protein [Sphaerochaetaceae bacterium]
MKKNCIAILIIALAGVSGLAFANGLDADDMIDHYATLDSFEISTVPADAVPATLRNAIQDGTSWGGSALVTVNKDGSPSVAFYDIKSVPGRNQILYISDKLDRTTYDNLRKREEAMHVNMILDNGILSLDGPRTLVEYVDDKDDIRWLDKRTGGKYTYLEVEHIYSTPTAIIR